MYVFNSFRIGGLAATEKPITGTKEKKPVAWEDKVRLFNSINFNLSSLLDDLGSRVVVKKRNTRV